MLDPRTAPLIGIDRQLPALPAQRLRGPALRQRFATPIAWQPESVRDPHLPPAPNACPRL